MQMGVWYLVTQSDWISKGILLVLLIMSCVCWSVALYRYLLFRAKIQHIKQVMNALRSVKTFEEFLAKVSLLEHDFAGSIIAHHLADFKKLLQLSEVQGSLSAEDWKSLQTSMGQTIDSCMQREEVSLTFLTASYQSAPLIGLFGTVWGLIHAFIGISQARSADIASVAPGIAEALITTLAGLIVAIPALVLVNYLQGRLAVLEQQLIALSEHTYHIMRMFSITASKKASEPNQFDFSTNQEFKRDVL